MKKTPDFWVGDRIVRPSVGEIQLGLDKVHLEPRSMEVLVALARRAPEVAPKQDLIEEVWGEAFVTDEVLTHAIWDLRRAFGDHASDPEFIQTIPKKGYRLIAPVKEIETDPHLAHPSQARSPLSLNVLLRILGAVVLLAAISFWMGQATSPHKVVDRRPPTVVLTLLPTSPFEGSEGWPERLNRQLGARLEGLQGVEVRLAEACQTDSRAENEYCIEPFLSSITDGYRASIRLRKTASHLIYTTPSVNLASRSELDAAVEELVVLLRICLEVFRKWDLEHPDIRPWISLQDNRIRAIRYFLHSLDYVYRHEIGGRNPLEAAIEIDPLFIAPRVWRTPTIIAEEDDKTIADHRAGLQSLYKNASAFEQAMITWAKALIDEEPTEQLRQLRVAHKQEPRNRQVRMVLAGSTLSLGDIDEAWRLLESLLQDEWCYPPLYPLAARCALYRESLDDARGALELALACKPVDPDSLALLRLLAVYEGDAEGETRYGEWLERRTMEMLPEVLEVDVSGPAELLAAQAENEGYQEIAARLREFAD